MGGRLPVRFEFSVRKALAGLLYFASESQGVTALDKYKLAKLVFLADKYHLVRYGRPIFGDFYRALEWGPVPRQILNALDKVIKAVDRPPSGELERLLASHVDIDRTFEHPRFRSRVSWGE